MTKRKRKQKNKAGRFFLVLLLLLLAVAAAVLGVNGKVVSTGMDRLAWRDEGEGTLPEGEALERLQALDAQCVIVLGAGILDEETPTDMLRDRLDTGIAMYRAGLAPKILLTGDNGTEVHNELHVMLRYCLDAGVPAEDIFCDHAGFSTSESVVRAAEIFGVERAIIVTQRYHEFRALFLAEGLGIDALGVSSDQHVYADLISQEVREILARNKDFLLQKMDRLIAMDGEPIDITGDGTVSHGE
ncbi:MAG: YdcF family protein [Eubacterium sp.]|nr:YdcF family protein [Eubacterium sp.]